MHENEKQWLTLDLLKATEGYFRAKHIDEPRLSAEVLLSCVLNTDRMDLYLNYNRPVYRDEIERFRSFCRERVNGRPVQYITGEQIFYGYRFAVDERVLIPRPETELMLEHAVERLTDRENVKTGKFSILDIGTGSGCIAVTLAHLLPESTLTAIDLSEGALEVARNNADAHHVGEKIRFLCADAMSSGFTDRVGEKYDMIVSNPPYIPEKEWESLQPEVKDHEPKVALTTSDGYGIYHAITKRAPKLLVSGGILCFELHADGAPKVTDIVRCGGFGDIEVHKDYSGADRVLSCVLTESAAEPL